MSSENHVVVEIPQGKLRGKKDLTCYGKDFYCFHQIPYAKPPVGELRFKAPEPAEGWTGVRDATEEGKVCPSTDMQKINYLANSDEDSLFINVYCKYNPNATDGKKYPVLVWIHGGGFEFGSGNRGMCGPDFFMIHDVILVTFNYRLGALGFLNLQIPECPGNYGLKDQTLALKWIKNNITYFGGDSENITIVGVSAGAASVHYQTFILSSKDLFKRAIAQSGSSLNRWGFCHNPRENAFTLGRRLGCDTKDEKVLLDFLRKVPAQDIVLKSQRMLEETSGLLPGEKFLQFSFTPSLEPDHEGAVISKHTWHLLNEGRYLDIPYMTGICEKEMILGVSGKDDYPKYSKDEEFQNLIPRGIRVKSNEQALNIAKKLREFYFKDGINLENYINILSDTFFNFGVYKVVKCRLTNKNLKSPTYLYQFNYEGDQPFIKQLLGLTDIQGASHGEDIGYLFKTDFTNMAALSPGSRDYKFMMNMTKLWVNFATTGVPRLEEPELVWKETNLQDFLYLDLNENLEMKKGFLGDRMEFWNEIYTSYHEDK